MIRAEIIAIGDELLIGQVVNTNAVFITKDLGEIGIKTVQMTTIGDGAEEIEAAVAEALGRAEVVLITGGLGPTKDDITKTTLCKFFHTTLRRDAEVLANVERLFAKKGYPMTETNRRQADVPVDCTVLPNPIGTAPGMWFEREGRVVVSMPGVPFETERMMKEEVLPKLQKFFSTDVILHKTVLTQGVGESFLSDRIEQWELALPPHIRLAYLPQAGMVRLRLSASGKDKEALRAEVDAQVKQLEALIGDCIFGYDEDTLESVVGQALRKRGMSVATAESCTGGCIAHKITSVSGSSDYYKGSVVAYANETKVNVLGVPAETIEKYGAVSEQTAIAMARGVRKLLATDFAVATTGTAGSPLKGEAVAVGTVFIAVAGDGVEVVRKFTYGDDRLRTIQRASYQALKMLLDSINI